MTTIDKTLHPCFNAEAKGKFGRVHIPVAPDCNIKCNYCDRKHDCVNESRPGVTSSILSPEQSLLYVRKVLEKMPNTTVVGIAGPGDAFATPEITMETLRLIRAEFPKMMICLATNGLNILPYVDELARIGISHVTITINAVDPEIGTPIYAWIRDGKVIYRGKKAAELIISRQLEAIRELKRHGITVKVNTIIIPTINEHHVSDVARKVAELGADLHNCMVMYRNKGTRFGDLPEIPEERIQQIRSEAETFMPQMKHCTRCRADAVGLLGDDKAGEFRGCLSDCSSTITLNRSKPYVAVATMEGVLVNRHLGEARKFQIWGEYSGGYKILEERIAPEAGTGVRRWLELAALLNDCRAVLVNGIGETPKHVLEEHNIRAIEMEGLIKTGLEAVYNNGNVAALKIRKSTGCSKGVACSGTGDGCG